jgi:hypothetical protein
LLLLLLPLLLRRRRGAPLRRPRMRPSAGEVKIVTAFSSSTSHIGTTTATIAVCRRVTFVEVTAAARRGLNAPLPARSSRVDFVRRLPLFRQPLHPPPAAA